MTNAFGLELRRHCNRFSSIAQVCEGIGINRQQFNKYLAGQILPSARTLRKICAYLGVSEAQLISGGDREQTTGEGQGQPGASARGASEIDLSKLGRLVPPGMASALPMPLRCGVYECFTVLPGTQGLVARSLLTLETREDGLFFSQRSLFLSSYGGTRQAVSAHYEGVVLCGLREAYLVGGNTMAPFEPSVLSLSMFPAVGEDYYTGLTLAHEAERQVAGSIALRYLGEKGDERQATPRAGHYHLSDTALDPVIARLLTARRATTAAA